MPSFFKYQHQKFSFYRPENGNAQKKCPSPSNLSSSRLKHQEFLIDRCRKAATKPFRAFDNTTIFGCIKASKSVTGFELFTRFLLFIGQLARSPA
jgi:hypothetical protein